MWRTIFRRFNHWCARQFPEHWRVVGELPVSHATYSVSRFMCPECGHSYFTSTEMPDGAYRRYCRGVRKVGRRECTYTWLDRDDDQHFWVPLKYVINKVGPL